MAETSSEVQNPLNCPICLDLFKDPVTTSCGHSFCMECINKYCNRVFWSKVYSCPTCRQTFNQKPVFTRNIVLCQLLEKTRDAPKAGPGDVPCDVCMEQKLKAIKFCLVCLASYCQSHIQPHYKSEAFKKHRLVEPGLQQQICPQHHKALEIYCKDDRQCICVLCLGDKHKGHKTNSAASQMVEEKNGLKKRQGVIKLKLSDKNTKMKAFVKAVNSHKSSAQTSVQHIDKTFAELISLIQKRHKEVRDKVHAHMRQEVAQTKNHIQTLEREIGNLQKEENNMEPFLQTEDYNEFFQNYNPSSGLPFDPASLKQVNNLVTFKNVEESVSEFKTKLESICDEHSGKILKTVADVKILKDTLHCVPISSRSPESPWLFGYNSNVKDGHIWSAVRERALCSVVISEPRALSLPERGVQARYSALTQSAPPPELRVRRQDGGGMLKMTEGEAESDSDE